METNKKEESNKKTIELTVEYTESDLHSTIEVDPSTKLSDIKSTAAIYETYNSLSKIPSIGMENLKFPPSIYVKLNDNYLKNLTISKAETSFGTVIVSIPSVGAPLANEAAKVHSICEANLILSDFHEKTVIPSIKAMEVQQNYKETDIINRHVKEGKVLKVLTVTERLQKIDKDIQDMKETHEKDIQDMKETHEKDINDLKVTHNNDIAKHDAKFEDIDKKLSNMTKSFESEKVIHRLANFISLFRDRIAQSRNYNTWNDMKNSDIKVTREEIETSVVSLGLSIFSWNKCLVLASNLNISKHGEVALSDRIEFLNKIRGTTYNEYVAPLTELIGLFSD